MKKMSVCARKFDLMMEFARRNRLWLAAGVLSLLVLSVAAAPVYSYSSVRRMVSNGKYYVYMRDLARFYNIKYYIGDKECGFLGKDLRIDCTYEKKHAEVNGVTVTLINPIIRDGREPLISEQDFLILLDPIINPASLPSHKLRVILLDPGHGGQDIGGRGRYYMEKDVNLRIAYKLRDKLVQRGYLVMFTRNSDYFIPLPDRAYDTVRRRADLYISIHANISSSSYVSGVETYCLPPAGAASTNENRTSYKTEAGNTFDKNNARLAYEVQRSIVATTGAEDRGVKWARFLVLRNITCPGVLIETGFLSNANEERSLGRPAYQDQMAESIANAVMNYHADLRKN